jgi:hypothetical protein
MAIPMKTDLIKFNIATIKNLRGILAGLVTTLIFLHLLPKAWSVDLYWANGATPAMANAPGFIGTWATGLSEWPSTPMSSVSAPWVDGSVAHFLGSGGGTVIECAVKLKYQ